MATDAVGFSGVFHFREYKIWRARKLKWEGLTFELVQKAGRDSLIRNGKETTRNLNGKYRDNCVEGV